MICINIKYGCGHLGVATFAFEILRMSEIALDPHLGQTILRCDSTGIVGMNCLSLMGCL